MDNWYVVKIGAHSCITYHVWKGLMALESLNNLNCHAVHLPENLSLRVIIIQKMQREK